MLNFFRRPSLDSLAPAADTWQERERSAEHVLWLTSTSDAILHRFYPVAPTVPYDLSDIDGARSFFAQESVANKGVMVSLAFDPEPLLHVRGVFKYRAPAPHDMAMYYVGILVFLFRASWHHFSIEAIERGITGSREAAVSLLLDEPSSRTDEPVAVASFDELFAIQRSSALRVLPSDDEQWDITFPNHPLSKVRALQRHIETTLAFPSWLRSLPPYRRRR